MTIHGKVKAKKKIIFPATPTRDKTPSQVAIFRARRRRREQEGYRSASVFELRNTGNATAYHCVLQWIGWTAGLASSFCADAVVPRQGATSAALPTPFQASFGAMD